MAEEVEIDWDVADVLDTRDNALIKKIFQDRPSQIAASASVLGGWLHYAAGQTDVEVVALLVSLGFDINARDDFDGAAPLCDACRSGHFAIAQYLLDHGAAIDTSLSIRNPLFAAISGSIEMNKTWGPPTGEAPQIVRLLLGRGIDAKVTYNSKTMKNMDAVAFAMMMGARDLAHIIALWNEGNDETRAKTAMDEGLRIAFANTKPVPKGEQVAPS